MSPSPHKASLSRKEPSSSHNHGGATQDNTPAAGRPYDRFDGQYINGAWKPGSKGTVLKDINPYNGETVAEITLATQGDLDEAYKAAQKAQREWAKILPMERANIFRKAATVIENRKEEVINWLIREAGSTRIKAEIEWSAVHASMLEAMSLPYRIAGKILPVDVPGKESRIYRRPIGVVGVISPWNWPMQLTHRSVAPAIALGNGVVVKPSEDTPVTGGLLIARIYEEAGLPPGLLNVIVGDVEDIGDAFTLHPIPRFISFTGSTKVGKHIGELASQGTFLKKVGLELGGNAPFVVLEDADIDLAARAAVFGRFLHQGQICMSTNRLIVHHAVYDEFVDKFVERVRNLKVGDPDEPDTAIGPIINRQQLDSMVRRIEEAKTQGMKPVLEGKPKGQVLPPHVFMNVTNNSDLAQAELFGPIAPIIRAAGEEEALLLANATPYGLSSAVFTRDEGRGLNFALRIQAGMTHINDISVNDDANNMFGGEKNSGIGRFGGEWVIEEMTTDHWITVQHEPRSYPF